MLPLADAFFIAVKAMVLFRFASESTILLPSEEESVGALIRKVAGPAYPGLAGVTSASIACTGVTLSPNNRLSIELRIEPTEVY